MKKLRLSWLLVMGAFLFSAWPAVAAEPADLAARVQDRQREIANLTADYRRVSRFVALAGQSAKRVEATGRLIWARPWNLRLTQTQPSEQLVVADQDKVWWVRPDRKRADLYPTKQFTSGLGSLMDALGGLGDLDQAFRVEQASAAEKAVHPSLAALALSPQASRADLSRLVVWFRQPDLTLGAFRIINLVGDETDYILSNVQLNQDLPAETFSYLPPQDYRLKDHVGAANSGQGE